MVKFYVCEDGFVEREDRGEHYWINVVCPDEADRAFMLDELGVPESFLDNIADIDERPRFEREDGWLLTIIRVPIKNPDDQFSYITVPVGIITRDDIILSLCYTDTEMIPDFIEHSRRRHIEVHSRPDFILRLIYSSTYWFLSYLKELNTTVSTIVDNLGGSVRNDYLINLMNLQKSLVLFNTSLKGNSMLVERLDKEFADDCDPDLLEDVSIELQQADNTVNVYMQILASSTDTISSIVSNNMNQIMKS